MLDERLISALTRRVGPDGAGIATGVPRLQLWSADRPTGSAPAMFEPAVYLVLQGVKRTVIAGATYDMSPGDCAVSIVGLPFRYQVMTATQGRPYLGAQLTLDPGMVAALLVDMPDGPCGEAPAFRAVPADDGIRECMLRLVRLTLTPEDVTVLAPLTERELLYRLLRSPLGGTLRRIADVRGNIAAIGRAVDHIRVRATCAVVIPEVAAAVGMSETSFHRHFKAVTGLSPLAYQRHIRLLDAQRRLAIGTPVTSVAFEVGYQSPSQFSREYKRMFGAPPQAHLRAHPA
ncbi:AraC family transcriptional regulator [Jiella mangrovi]|uniref:AraC family transcriptional regulator n=1 Tax=Jiella mangrovi TaxID=2821407 RepID=A0ABS4BH69_9HYPH|nr:AraC family transcriptional regulator [Jiella mangrovi]MBP0616090.1 AraC family transcriptional regulator [Jiella mangrovi]